MRNELEPSGKLARCTITSAECKLYSYRENCIIYKQLCLGCGYRNIAEDSERKYLHVGIQSDVDSERQQLEPFYNALRDLRIGTSF